MSKPDYTKPDPRWSEKNARRTELATLAANASVVGAARRHVEAELAKLDRDVDES